MATLESEKSTENVAPESEEKKDTGTPSTSSTASVEDVMAELEKQRAINKEVITTRDSAKARLKELETEHTTKLQESETKVAELTTQYESTLAKTTELESRLKDVTITSSLTNALTEAGVASINTAMKLVDKDAFTLTEDGKVDDAAIADAIASLKEEHEILFGAVGKPVVKGPTPVRPSEEKNTGGYAEELRRLRENPSANRKDFEAIKRKYGRA